MVVVIALVLTLTVAVLALARWLAARRRTHPARLLRVRLETARSRHRIAARSREMLRATLAAALTSAAGQSTEVGGVA